MSKSAVLVLNYLRLKGVQVLLINNDRDVLLKGVAKVPEHVIEWAREIKPEIVAELRSENHAINRLFRRAHVEPIQNEEALLCWRAAHAQGKPLYVDNFTEGRCRVYYLRR